MTKNICYSFFSRVYPCESRECEPSFLMLEEQKVPYIPKTSRTNRRSLPKLFFFSNLFSLHSLLGQRAWNMLQYPPWDLIGQSWGCLPVFVCVSPADPVECGVYRPGPGRLRARPGASSKQTPVTLWLYRVWRTPVSSYRRSTTTTTWATSRRTTSWRMMRTSLRLVNCSRTSLPWWVSLGCRRTGRPPSSPRGCRVPPVT